MRYTACVRVVLYTYYTRKMFEDDVQKKSSSISPSHNITHFTLLFLKLKGIDR